MCCLLLSTQGQRSWALLCGFFLGKAHKVGWIGGETRAITALWLNVPPLLMWLFQAALCSQDCNIKMNIIHSIIPHLFCSSYISFPICKASLLPYLGCIQEVPTILSLDKSSLAISCIIHTAQFNSKALVLTEYG